MPSAKRACTPIAAVALLLRPSTSGPQSLRHAGLGSYGVPVPRTTGLRSPWTSSPNIVAPKADDIAVPSDAPLRVAVIADTHGRPHPDSARLIAEQKPQAIVHAGDIGPADTLDGFTAIAPLLAVRGNIDVHAREFPDERLLSLKTTAGSELVRVFLTHIAMAGPRLRADVARRATSLGAKLVICGHSHVPFLGRDRGLSVFNPGSIGPRRFSLPIVFGMLELRDQQLSLWHVDCETGGRWLP